jgi:palmitoyl-protein thioesterase
VPCLTFFQKSFWKDVLHYEAYTELNNFLADINNERETKDSQYRTNLLQLDNFLCIYGLLDEVVIPQTSPIFSFFPPGNTSVVLPFEQTPQYSGDWLGLRTLQQSKRLHFASVNCTHTGAPSNQCKPMIWPLTIPFLNN